jgi:hypothetical protein
MRKDYFLRNIFFVTLSFIQTDLLNNIDALTTKERIRAVLVVVFSVGCHKNTNNSGTIFDRVLLYGANFKLPSNTTHRLSTTAFVVAHRYYYCCLLVENSLFLCSITNHYDINVDMIVMCEAYDHHKRSSISQQVAQDVYLLNISKTNLLCCDFSNSCVFPKYI